MLRLIRHVLIFIILFFVHVVFAANYALVVVGPEDSPDKTDFQFNSEQLIKFGDKSKWNVSYLDSQSQTNAPDFTSKNFKIKLDELRHKIKDNKIVKDDQLMVYIMAHGAPNNGKQKTHSVGALKGTVNLDYLRSLKKMAEKKGVKLAIIDQSCYSGELIKLGSDKTCVISSTTENNFGYQNTPDFVALGLVSADSNSLEDIFLTTRNLAFSPGQPMISTDPGKKTAVAVEIFKNTLYHDDFLRQKLSCYANSPEMKKNVLDTQLLMLKTMIKDPAVYEHAKKTISEALSIKNKLTEQGEILEQESKKEIYLACSDRIIRLGDETNKEFCFGFDSLAKAKLELDKAHESLKKLEDESFIDTTGITVELPTIPSPKKIIEQKNYFKSKIKAIENMIANGTVDRAIQANKQKDEDLKKQTILYNNLIYDLSEKERQLYDRLYRHFKAESKKKNPCADFKI